MSTFKHSKQMRPRYESAPYHMTPARREHIYGRVHPMNKPHIAPGALLVMLAVAVFLGFAIAAQF